MAKKEIEKMTKFIYKFGKWKFELEGNGYRDAVRKNKKIVQKAFKKMPEKLPMLVQIKKGNGYYYWDIRQFFKEAGIKVEVENG